MTAPRCRNLGTAESPEVAALLNWMADGNFVLLGFREYQVSGQASERKAAVRRGTGLGILRSEEKSRWNEAQRLPDLLRRYLNEPPLLMVGRTRSVSPIWRRESMDVIAVKEIDSSGVVCGEKRFIGLFAPELSAAPSEIPVLSEKLRFLLGAAEAEEGLRPSDLNRGLRLAPSDFVVSRPRSKKSRWKSTRSLALMNPAKCKCGLDSMRWGEGCG